MIQALLCFFGIFKRLSLKVEREGANLLHYIFLVYTSLFLYDKN